MLEILFSFYFSRDIKILKILIAFDGYIRYYKISEFW